MLSIVSSPSSGRKAKVQEIDKQEISAPKKEKTPACFGLTDGSLLPEKNTTKEGRNTLQVHGDLC